MNLAYIKNIINHLKQSRFNEFYMKTDEFNIKIKFLVDEVKSNIVKGIDNYLMDKNNKEKVKNEHENIKIITAPLVGRFYSTLSSDTFKPIKVGDKIEKNQPICMIEAMNIEHIISCPYSGILHEVLVDDGVPVMYGQPLFKIKIN